jgi:hypothetical protein
MKATTKRTKKKPRTPQCPPDPLHAGRANLPIERLAVLLAWMDEGGCADSLERTVPLEIDAFARDPDHFIARRAHWRRLASVFIALLNAAPSSEEAIGAQWAYWHGEDVRWSA